MRAFWFSRVAGLQAFTLCTLVGLFILLRQECFSAEARNVACLSQFSGAVDALIQFVYSRTKESSKYFLLSVRAGLLFLFVLFVVGLRSAPLKGERWFYFLAITLALLGELMALRRDPWLTLYYHLGALVCGVLAMIISKVGAMRGENVERGVWITFEGGKTKPRITEYITVALIFVILGALRFYALNRNPIGLDDESCPHRAICFSWKAILEQELGANWQQASGLSWVVVHRIFTRFADPLLYYLDQRVLSVGISLLNCWLVFFLVRYLRGPFAAVLALVLYGFGPLDFEWSRLPTLHALPVTVGLILTWVSFWAFRNPSWMRFIWVGALIFLTKFFYPSAKALALGPLTAACTVFIWNYPGWQGHKKKLLLIPLGIAAFLAFRPVVFYFWFGRVRLVSPVQHMYLHDGAGWFEVAQKYAREAFGFIYEIFYAPFGPSHWTIQTTLEPLRSVSSVCVVFIAMALLRLLFTPKSLNSTLCMGLLLGGALPGIAAGMADRRVAFALVFIVVLVAIEISWFFDRIVMTRSRAFLAFARTVLIGCLTVCLGVGQVFAMFSRKQDKPLQVILAERIRPLIRQDTFVVYMIEPRNCEFFFGIYDLLDASNGRVAFATSIGDMQLSRELVQTPRIKPGVWFYEITPLKKQVQTIQATQTWQRVLYVFPDGSIYSELENALTELYPRGVVTTAEYSTTQPFRYVVFDTNPEMLDGY